MRCGDLLKSRMRPLAWAFAFQADHRATVVLRQSKHLRVHRCALDVSNAWTVAEPEVPDTTEREKRARRSARHDEMLDVGAAHVLKRDSRSRVGRVEGELDVARGQSVDMACVKPVRRDVPKHIGLRILLFLFGRV